MDKDYIERHEFDHYAQRMEDEHARQNHRILELENITKQIAIIASSVEKLAFSLQSMVKEQEQQGLRIEVIEQRDGEMWRKVVSHTITVGIGIIVGFAFKQLGM